MEPQGLSAASDDAYHDLKPLQDRHEMLYLSWKAVPYPESISDFEEVLGYVWLIYVCYDCWSEVAALLRDADAASPCAELCNAYDYKNAQWCRGTR